MIKIDLRSGKITPKSGLVSDWASLPRITGRLPGHTVLMWDLDAPACSGNTNWLHMLWSDNELYYQGPCPPNGTHTYAVAQFPTQKLDLHWKYGCVEIPNPTGKVLKFTVEQAKNPNQCGQLVHK